jgi:hypothetical protein
MTEIYEVTDDQLQEAKKEFLRPGPAEEEELDLKLKVSVL